LPTLPLIKRAAKASLLKLHIDFKLHYILIHFVHLDFTDLVITEPNFKNIDYKKDITGLI